MNETDKTNHVESNHLDNSRTYLAGLTALAVILLGVLICSFDNAWSLLGLLIGLVGFILGITAFFKMTFTKMSQVVLTIAASGLFLSILGHINGIFGYIGLLVDVVAFVSGIAVFFKITFSKKKEKGRLLAIAAVFLSILAIRLVGTKGDGRGDFNFYQRQQCLVTLHGLANSFDLYQYDFAGKNPSDLKVLMQHEDVPLRMLTCQATKDYEDRYKDSRFWYVYRGNDLDNTCPDGLIVLHDRLGTHQDGRNVLFFAAEAPRNEAAKANDPAKWLTEEEFQEAIKKDNALRRKIGLPEKDIQGNVITP